MRKVITLDYVKWSMDNTMAEEVFLKHPIKSWAEDIEAGALQQLKNVANLPFLFKHAVALGGIHQGYGMPIECVMATDHVVVPNAVGVDIGCGMAALQLPETLKITTGEYQDIQTEIKRLIPVGFSHQSVAGIRRMKGKGIALPFIDSTLPITGATALSTIYGQLGTLGGGNHFVEMLEDRLTNGPWIMIHSGSRNIGLKVAAHHNKVAKRLNEKWYSSVPVKHDLAFLPLRTPEAKLYLQEMTWCLEFAKLNREIMMGIVIDIIADVIDRVIPLGTIIDVHHNYAAMENHFGKNVLVHRKGATAANFGEWVVIPGSMGTKSYIGLGVGNRDSFNSCSHGAGRTMGRGVAKRTLDFKEQRDILDRQGIVHDMKMESLLDEAPGAYKDIDMIMANQEDLLDITNVLRPKMSVKDTSKKRNRFKKSTWQIKP